MPPKRTVGRRTKSPPRRTKSPPRRRWRFRGSEPYPHNSEESTRSLERLVAENITKQTLAQLPASAIVELLGVDKLRDILQHMGQTDRSMVLAALPKPNESLWCKESSGEWFYKTHGSSPIRLQWNRIQTLPRYLGLYENSTKRTTAVAATPHEVETVIVPELIRYNITEDAITDVILAAAEYFTSNTLIVPR